VIVKSLTLVNVRAVEFADFLFKPGFNLLVGVNGVGKSTVLDTIRICMSRVLPVISESRAKAISFVPGDILGGRPWLDAELRFTLGTRDFRFTRRQWRKDIAPDDPANLRELRRQVLESERLQDRRRDLLRQLEAPQGVADRDSFAPSKSELKETAAGASPNCVFFSPVRSFLGSTGQSRVLGGVATAYYRGLHPRRLDVPVFADWMRVQAAMADERPRTARHLRVLQAAIERFLPAYRDLHVPTGGSRLRINRNGTALDVLQLSDGERGVLALVLDLAKRLSQANPSLDDPLTDGKAVVLIDELELHLHPKWQRQIVGRLQKTFPRCQFIATTHSPQVVGELAHDRIQIMTDGGVYSPTHSFGVDSSRVLEEIMDAPPRNRKVTNLLARMSREVGEERYGKARESLANLVEQVGEGDPEVTRIRTLLDFMEGED